jgi:hypothetical protein
MYKVREKKRALEGKIKELDAEYAKLEAALMELMDEAGVTKSTGSKASVSISTNIRPSVENWDLFYEYIRKNKYFHLLERRPSVSGCNELMEGRGKIPGVVPFVQRRINLRTVN